MRTAILQKEPAETLDISRETLAYLIVKARSFDAQLAVLGGASEASDDRDLAALEGWNDDPTAAELASSIAGLSPEEQAALVALVWIGRGDFDAAEWDDAKRLARERRVGPTARYLLGIPLLGDYLEEGAAALGINLTEDEANS